MKVFHFSPLNNKGDKCNLPKLDAKQRLSNLKDDNFLTEFIFKSETVFNNSR